MFSALNQGSLVYIIDKTDGIKFKVGEIIGVSQLNYGSQSFNSLNQVVPTLDLKIKADNETLEFNAIPSNLSTVAYNNGKLIISETKQGVQTEVEAVLQNSKQIVNNIDYYKDTIVDCENILKQLNPQFAKDKERDETIDNLKSKVDNMEIKIDKLLTLMSNNQKD